MVQKRVPDPQVALVDLRAFLIMLYEAFESASQRTREFFEESELTANPYLQAHLIRAFVAEYLQNLGHDAIEFDQENLANSGIAIVACGYHIRLWKSDKGQLPPPGRSSVRQRFYNQVHQLLLPLGDLAAKAAAMRSVKCNVALLWDLSPTGNLAQLWIAAPKSGTQRRARVYWTLPVPHPAELAQTPNAQDAMSVDDDDLSIIPFDETEEQANQDYGMPLVEPVADEITMEVTNEGDSPTEEAQ